MDKKKNIFLRISIVILLLLSFFMIYFDFIYFADCVILPTLPMGDEISPLVYYFRTDLWAYSLIALGLIVISLVIAIFEIFIAILFRKIKNKYLYKINLIIFIAYMLLNLAIVISDALLIIIER